jgi:hypothetical protein
VLYSPEEETALRKQANETLRVAVEAAKGLGNPHVARRRIRVASEIFFAELGRIRMVQTIVLPPAMPTEDTLRLF